MNKNYYKIILFFTVVLFSITTIKAQSVGGTTSGAASYCSGGNSGFVTLNGHVGTILFWQSSITGSAPWTNEPNPTSTHSYLNLTQTTYYRAVVQDGSFAPDTSTISIITIYPVADGGTIAGGGEFCVASGTGTLTLTGNAGGVVNWISSTNNGVSWTPIANTTTTLNYPNITQNTLYAAIIENEPTCPRDTSNQVLFEIFANSIAGTYNSNDSIICFGYNIGSIDLNGNLGDIIDWRMSINNGGNWLAIGNQTNTLSYLNLEETVWYQTIVQNGACGSVSTTPIKLTVVEANPVTAGEDEDIIQFETIELNGAGVGTPLWSPADGLDNPSLFNPLAKPYNTTTYIITLTDSNQCVSQDSVLITVAVPIPNAITPNGDGANDFFVIDKINNYPNNKFEVYNRYGSLIFDESPYTNSWEGKSSGGGDLPDGMYYYSLDYGDGQEVKTGYILIKR